jgi:hypothetical protein
MKSRARSGRFHKCGIKGGPGPSTNGVSGNEKHGSRPILVKKASTIRIVRTHAEPDENVGWIVRSCNDAMDPTLFWL